MRIGFVTIGQSPRPDLLAPFRARLGPGVAVLEAGALDGLTGEAIDAVAPAPGEEPLVTRLADGQGVVVAHERIAGLMQARLDALVAAGADSVVVLCTGPFPELRAPVPLLLPDPVLRHIVLGVLPPTSRLGVLMPIAGQAPMMREKWRDYPDLALGVADPYDPDPAALAAAVAAFRDCALVVLDCMGFTAAQRDVARRACGRPVLVAQEVLAQVVALLA